jgi:hypothetical protein
VGVAGLLVLAALYPFLFGRNREPEGGTPPAPDAKEAPTWAAQVTEPGTPLPGAANVSSEPETYFGPELPPLPDYINSSQIPGLEASSQPAPLGNPARAAAIDGRRLDAPTGRQSSNDTPQPSVLANQTMAIGGPMPGPAGVYADDLRRDYQADSRVGLPARQPGYSIPNGPPEPGVARLEGTIEGPAVRTTNDAARPSLY